ncbi:MAG: hypothetical protein MZV70_35795 [Desulfobacterales bacterium]|nr:hypothetical protein [Desulfobacterales bacterium]
MKRPLPLPVQHRRSLRKGDQGKGKGDSPGQQDRKAMSRSSSSSAGPTMPSIQASTSRYRRSSRTLGSFPCLWISCLSKRRSSRLLWPGMYWRSGQRILKAARIVRANPNLYAIYIGNFSCGPDSFILKYFKEEMEGKPFLHIEIDEHSADAGAITRCEAFLDSIDQQMRHGGRQEEEDDREFRSVRLLKCSSPANIYRTGSNRKRTMFIPRMTDHVHAVKAAFEYCGISAEILPESTKESVDLGRKYRIGQGMLSLRHYGRRHAHESALR